MGSMVDLILLILIANGAPVFMRFVFGDCCAWPVDFGKYLADGRRLFGQSKTWRGLLAAIAVTPLCAFFLGYSFETGLLVAILSMLGDLFSSFVKRRMNMPPSSMAFLLDQIPEALLPSFFLMSAFHLNLWSVILVVLIFVVVELVLSRLLYKWGVRRRPY